MAERRKPLSDESPLQDPNNLSAADKIAAARARQQSDDSDIVHERKREVNLVKHTETIDRLVVQNKQLQRDLSDADNEIDELEKKLTDSSIKISKNLFYIFLGSIGFAIYILMGHLANVNSKLVEMNVILKEYKSEIDKTKLYNDVLEKKIGIDKLK